MKLRPPATPIINIDPYFSVWAEESVLKNTVHWTGKPNTLQGRVFVDGEEYHFLGYNDRRQYSVDLKPDMQIQALHFDAYSTCITYVNGKIRLTVRFTSPVLVEDLYYASRPVAYAKVSYESLDGMAHDVTVQFAASEELVLNTRGEGSVVTQTVDVDGVTAIRMGNECQNVLWRDGDDIRIDWGYLYLGIKGEGKVENTLVDGMDAISAEAKLDKEALFLFAYDDIESIQYFGDNLKAYWKKDGKTICEAIAEAAREYDALLDRCNRFSDKLKSDAIAAGGEKYADLLLLAMRQVMAAHKLVVDKDGNNLYISKECNSNGCAATVDVTYPSAPLFLLYNTELLKGMLRPVLKYEATEEWIYDFAPHDVGRYPHVNGQAYWTRRNSDGSVLSMDPTKQMPVEECGNMLILFAAIAEADDDISFAAQHIDTVAKWSKYLIKYGLDPEDQLCTDDFAGHLAHNVNLSIKAIMGIAGYARILERLGQQEEAAGMMATARQYAETLVQRAKNADGSFRLAYDQPGTFSLKYNAVWDKIWGTKLFPDWFYAGEIARYKKEQLYYGVPLDSREKYTKSDWLVWAASLAEDKEDFNILVDGLWSAYNTMRSYVPMTDWYYTDTSHMRSFRHRSVQGGLFIKLMM